MQKNSTWRKAIAGFVCALLIINNISAQNCNCAATISLTTQSFNAASILPGQTICLSAGVRTSNLRIYNINGTKANRINIINCGGKVTFNLVPGLSYGIKFEQSSNFRFTGTGSSDFYGIVVDSAHQGMQLIDSSTDFEIDHIEIKHPGFAGIMAKTDSSGPRTGFIMKNVSFHDLYVHNTRDGEGFYIGNTSWSVNGWQHDIDSIEVYNNITDSTGSEGIQVGCTYSGHAKIYNNSVTHAGINPFAGGQSNGIQLGNGFSGSCYNNYIESTGSNGIVVLGPGNISVYNNIIVNPGAMAVYTGRATAEAGKTFNYLHNTIIMGNSTEFAFKFDPNTSSIANIYNNAIQHADTTTNNTIRRISGTMNSGGNVIRASSGSFKFENAGARNYDLLSGSDAIDAGVNVDAYNLHSDYENRSRPTGANYDAGAYEYQSTNGSDTGIAIYRVNAGGLEVTDNPINWISDKQATPCPYFDNTQGSNLTTGSDQPWSGTNNTDAPAQVFSTIRYAGTSASQVHYNFPVNNGDYIVNLYFAENSVQAAGQRVEDVYIEGTLKMDNFDIYATAGFKTAYKDSFTVTVTDGVLDVNFTRVTGNPQINAIEIRSLNAGARAINPPLTMSTFNSPENFEQNLKIYPIPLQSKLYIEKKGSGAAASTSEEVQVTLYNDMGSVLYKAKHAFAGGKLNPIDLSGLYMRSGTYFISISGPYTNETIHLSKQ